MKQTLIYIFFLLLGTIFSTFGKEKNQIYYPGETISPALKKMRMLSVAITDTNLN